MAASSNLSSKALISFIICWHSFCLRIVHVLKLKTPSVFLFYLTYLAPLIYLRLRPSTDRKSDIRFRICQPFIKAYSSPTTTAHFFGLASKMGLYAYHLPGLLGLLAVVSLSLAKVCPSNCDSCPTVVSSCQLTAGKVTTLVSACVEDCSKKWGYTCNSNVGGCSTSPDPHPPAQSPAYQGTTYIAGWGGLTVDSRSDNSVTYVSVWDAAKPQPNLVGRNWTDLAPGETMFVDSRLPSVVIVTKPKGANKETALSVQYNGQQFDTSDKSFCKYGTGGYNSVGQRRTNCGFTIQGKALQAYKAGTTDPA